MQKHGSNIYIVASTENENAKIWEVQQDTSTQKDEDISPLLKDLALKIAKDMSEKRSPARPGWDSNTILKRWRNIISTRRQKPK